MANLTPAIQRCRDAFGKVFTLEAQRDEALIRAIVECALIVGSMTDDALMAEIAKVEPPLHGDSPEAKFIDLVTRADDGTARLSRERRAIYANAILYLIDYGPHADDYPDKAIEDIRSTGGIDATAALYRQIRADLEAEARAANVKTAKPSRDRGSKGAQQASAAQRASSDAEIEEQLSDEILGAPAKPEPEIYRGKALIAALRRAVHPATPDPERLNALRLVQKMDSEGRFLTMIDPELRKFHTADEWRMRVERTRKEVEKRDAIIAGLRKENARLKRQLQRFQGFKVVKGGRA